MSDGLGFGYYTGDGPQDDLNVQAAQGQQGDGSGKSGIRQYLNSLEETNKKLMQRLEGLEQESRRNRVADVLESKGYDRGAAALYTGDPAKVDEWLATTGQLLAKRPDAQQGAGNGQQAAPSTTVPPDGQAQLQQLQQMGQQAAAPQGSDFEQSAAMAAITDPQKLTEYLASQGNEYARLYQNGGY